MELRSPTVLRYARARPVIECAQCGEQIFAPDWSEYLDDRRVRHLWGCEACGYRFETIARFPDAIAGIAG
jgi:ribosomal protein L37AE/L43A